MKKSTKGILATIPLVMGLAGSASAAMTDTVATEDVAESKNTAGTIDSLLNQYTGLTPGDAGNQGPATQSVPPSQQYSSFSGAAGSMSSYFSAMGVDKTAPNQPAPSGDFIASGSTISSNNADSGSGAAAPAVNAITAVHSSQDSLVGAVANGTAPTTASSNNSGPIFTADTTPQTPVAPPQETPVVPTPIPPAAALIGSGLTALAALRKRNQGTIAE
jgi:hypothetical protein